MLARLALTIILLALGAMFYRWSNHRHLKRVGQHRNTDPILQGLTLGLPTIVYFTTPTCVPCKTRQQPALQRLRAELGEALQIIQIDATQDPETASRWGVMSAPTTFILDGEGFPNAVNHGVADEQKLKRQVEAALKVA